MTSSNEHIFRVTGHLCGEFTVPGEFPTQGPVTRSFDVSFDLHPNKRLRKQWWGWWFETQSCSLWRHPNGLALDIQSKLKQKPIPFWRCHFKNDLLTVILDFLVSKHWIPTQKKTSVAQYLYMLVEAYRFSAMSYSEWSGSHIFCFWIL